MRENPDGGFVVPAVDFDSAGGLVMGATAVSSSYSVSEIDFFAPLGLMQASSSSFIVQVGD